MSGQVFLVAWMHGVEHEHHTSFVWQDTTLSALDLAAFGVLWLRWQLDRMRVHCESVMCVVRGMFVQPGVCLPRCRTAARSVGPLVYPGVNYRMRTTFCMNGCPLFLNETIECTDFQKAHILYLSSNFPDFVKGWAEKWDRGPRLREYLTQKW